METDTITEPTLDTLAPDRHGPAGPGHDVEEGPPPDTARDPMLDTPRDLTLDTPPEPGLDVAPGDPLDTSAGQALELAAEPAPSPAQPVEINADLCHAVAEDLHRRGKETEAETFYRAALALAPDRPGSWANLGLAVLKSGRAEEAIRCEREALRLDPSNAELHNNLGIAMHALNALAEAENHFRGAVRLAPNHANATLNLGVIRQSLGFLGEAETLYRQARALGCDEARVCNNLAMVLAEQGRLEEAEDACREALADNPDYPEAEVNLGMILLMRGKLKQAWRHYEARWRVRPLSALPQLPKDTRWSGNEPVAGKTVLLLAEQGFGDTMQFCRYAPMVTALGARVILAVPSVLRRLMGTLRGVDQVITQDDPLPEHDLHCSLMSLPMAFRTAVETIPAHVPYLAADPDSVAAWEKIIPSTENTSGPRVGLVWAGSRRDGQPQAAAVDQRRSMRLADMASLGSVPGCVFVSLQVGPPARQIDDATFPVINVAKRLKDFADTAALVQTLDLVIAVDTAVAHLAGALGKPVWLLSRYDACWRWMAAGDSPGPEGSPWYPTLRLFRQTSRGDWDGVIRRVAEALPGFRTLG